MLALQGLSWFTRKAIGLATVVVSRTNLHVPTTSLTDAAAAHHQRIRAGFCLPHRYYLGRKWLVNNTRGSHS